MALVEAERSADRKDAGNEEAQGGDGAVDGDAGSGGAPFDPLNPPTGKNPLPGPSRAPLMGMLREALRLPRHERSNPLPADKLAKVAEIEAALAAGLRPASPGKVGETMMALLSHYPGRPMSDTERVSMARDWIVDLSGPPADIIAAACQEWRQGSNRFAPKPGELRALAKPALEARRLYHRIATEWLGAQRGAAGENERRAD